MRGFGFTIPLFAFLWVCLFDPLRWGACQHIRAFFGARRALPSPSEGSTEQRGLTNHM